MKKKIIISLIFLSIIFVFIIIAVFIHDYKMLDWKYIKNDEGILEIEVEGVKYGQYETLQWRPSNTSDIEKVGESIYYYTDDIDNIFILLWEDTREKVGARILVKEDANLPPFDVEYVSKVVIKFPFYKSEDENFFKNEIDSNVIIKKLFEEMDEEEYIESDFLNDNRKKKTYSGVGELVFYNDDLRGVEVSKEIYAIGDKYLIHIMKSNIYAEISKELLSEITGFDMPEAKDFAKLSLEEIYDFYGVDFN